jgi:hypothetical protein
MAAFEVIIYGRFWVIAEVTARVATDCSSSGKRLSVEG